jgi:chaperonin GroES
MTTALLLPAHSAKRKAAEQAGFEHDKLPKPTGWRLLIMPYNPPTKTKGGVELPDEVHERDRIATVTGLVLAVGPLAYKDSTKFGNPSDSTEKWQPWCKKNDWVLFSKYSGSRFKIDGGELRILNDDEILAVIDDPSHLMHT